MSYPVWSPWQRQQDGYSHGNALLDLPLTCLWRTRRLTVTKNIAGSWRQAWPSQDPWGVAPKSFLNQLPRVGSTVAPHDTYYCTFIKLKSSSFTFNWLTAFGRFREHDEMLRDKCTVLVASAAKCTRLWTIKLCMHIEQLFCHNCSRTNLHVIFLPWAVHCNLVHVELLKIRSDAVKVKQKMVGNPIQCCTGLSMFDDFNKPLNCVSTQLPLCLPPRSVSPFLI